MNLRNALLILAAILAVPVLIGFAAFIFMTKLAVLAAVVLFSALF